MIYAFGFWFLLGVVVGVVAATYASHVALAPRAPRDAHSSHAPASPSRPPVVAPADSPALVQTAPHELDAAHDPATIDAGAQYLKDQARANGTPLTAADARIMAIRMLNGEEV